LRLLGGRRHDHPPERRPAIQAWQDDLPEILQAARGRIPVDLLLTGARVANLFTGEILDSAVAVHRGRIVGFGPREAVEVLDLGGRHLVPGLIDGHVHIESSMVTPGEFARAVVPRGTTTVVADPHEFANVCGMDGVEFVRRGNDVSPLEIQVMLPSCVPATGMETSGARLDARDLEEALTRPNVLGLGEVMDYPGVLSADEAVLAKLRVAAGRPVDGHAPGLSGPDLHAYVAAGIGSDHECTTAQEALEKLRVGMHIMLREGSVTRDLEALLPVVNAQTVARCMLVTDDREPEDLLEEGHMDFLVRKAVGLGLPPLQALSMVSLNPARYFGLRGLGAIAPGYQADLVVCNDLRDFRADLVFKRGRLVARGGQAQWERQAQDAAALSNRVHLGPLGPDALEIPARGPRIRVIDLVPDQIVTRQVLLEPKVVEGRVVSDPGRDLLRLAVLERHHGTGRIGLGMARGFGLKRGALASTVAHDSHNLAVVGVDEADLRLAIAEVQRLGGGLVAVADGEVLASLPLPVAGLVCDRPLTEVREAIRLLHEAAESLGCLLPRPFMSLAFLALPVVPTLKLTDRGLVDVEAFRLVDLFMP